MTTDKQIEANRRNARKSTGPRTEEGKARSSRNAIKHGLTAEKVILPGEDLAYFEAFRFGLFESLRPEGVYETQLVLRLAAQQWRLQRIPAIEAELWVRLSDPIPGFGDPFAGKTIAGKTIAGKPIAGQALSGTSTDPVTDPVTDPQKAAIPDLGRAWMNDGDSAYGGALGRLARYETTLERSCTRITAELRRVQRHRIEMEAEERKMSWEGSESEAQPDHSARNGTRPAPAFRAETDRETKPLVSRLESQYLTGPQGTGGMEESP